MNSFLIRGFLIGSSVGVFAVLLGFVGTSEGIIFGSVAGLLAGLTSARLNEKRKRDRDGQ